MLISGWKPFESILLDGYAMGKVAIGNNPILR